MKSFILSILLLILPLSYASTSAANEADKTTQIEFLLGNTVTFTQDIVIKAGQGTLNIHSPTNSSLSCWLEIAPQSQDFLLKKDSSFIISAVDSSVRTDWDSDGERRYLTYISQVSVSLDGTPVKIQCEDDSETSHLGYVSQKDFKTFVSSTLRF